MLAVSFRLAPDVLVSVAAILAVGIGSGRVATRVGLPDGVAAVLAGIVLGPTVLGGVWPSASSWLYPTWVARDLAVIALVGLVLTAFRLGLGLVVRPVGPRRRLVVTVAVGAVGGSLAGGALLSPWLHSLFDVRVGRSGFTLLVVALLVVTATATSDAGDSIVGSDHVPSTLARAVSPILAVVAWLALAASIAITGASGAADVAATVGWSLGAAALLVGAVRPVVARHEVGAAGLVVVAALAGGAFQLAGLHPVVGALAAGVVVAQDGDAARRFEEQAGPFVRTVLTPILLVTIGLAVDLGDLTGIAMWVAVPSVAVVALASKFGSSAASAWLGGLDRPRAISVGVLLTGPGLHQFVVLEAARTFGVLDQRLFSVLVVALVVTAACSALLNAIAPGVGDHRATPVSSPEPIGPTEP